MNEKQFEKYLEKTADRLYKETVRFFKKYPDYDKAGYGEGFLSITVFEDSLSVTNSANAEKEIRVLKVKQDGKMEKIR